MAGENNSVPPLEAMMQGTTLVTPDADSWSESLVDSGELNNNNNFNYVINNFNNVTRARISPSPLFSEKVLHTRVPNRTSSNPRRARSRGVILFNNDVILNVPSSSTPFSSGSPATPPSSFSAMLLPPFLRSVFNAADVTMENA